MTNTKRQREKEIISKVPKQFVSNYCITWCETIVYQCTFAGLYALNLQKQQSYNDLLCLQSDPKVDKIEKKNRCENHLGGNKSERHEAIVFQHTFVPFNTIDLTNLAVA